MILSVDAALGKCRAYALPASLSNIGGRALASLLASGEGGLIISGEPCMVLAPGLLAEHSRIASGRCAVSCVLPEMKGIANSSAGGTAALALIGCGLKALIVRGTRQDRALCDLVVDGSGGRLIPIPGPEHFARFEEGPVPLMAALARQWPDAACIICTGRLGRLHVPISGTTFSGPDLRPSSHAGSFSGLVLGKAGIRSIIILRAAALREDTTGNMAVRPFVDALRSYSAREGMACSLQCASHCPGDGGKAHGSSLRKWPGFAKVWSSGDKNTDAAAASRYAILCDILQLDAFALATRLEELAEQKVLLAGDAGSALKELASLVHCPEEARLLPWLQGWMPKRRPGPSATQRRFLMDTLGLCRFAMKALEGDVQVRDALAGLISAAARSSAEELTALADAVLLREEMYAPPSRDPFEADKDKRSFEGVGAVDNSK